MHLDLFDTNFNEADVKNFPKLAARDDTSRSVEDRARSYLDADCAQCRPKGTVAYFDTRYDTPTEQQGLIGGQVLIDQRIDGARVIAPNDIWRSILFMRATPWRASDAAAGAVQTGLGHGLLRQWIESLPGHRAAAARNFTSWRKFTNSVTVTIKSEPGGDVRYTVDGTVPTPDDLLYEKPVELTSPTILRAKAFKPGSTKSITAKEIYLFGQ